MNFRRVAGALAVLLFCAYFGSLAYKIREPSLIVVVLIGVGLMARDLWESLRGNDK